ncbi:DExH-box ATP-dependent RNA helicase DExH17 [Gastrolobium bilobum]|uniref:DExH-box ATP-dependent RNA helicase DExH17 n=1 Tax=Gastrolobium bilobum TaxID=150636 RepID=UPI002AAF21F8|nr:DExH-box ATP-dependent RNA helicase DExH17 [Gastrolobium bilobum]
MDSYSLKSMFDLPAPFRSCFNFRYFNSLQSECFPICFHSDVNMVISAPTGSGKTVLFELCILRLLSRSISAEGRFIHVKGSLKTIYIAPSKALVQEKLRDWNQKFGPWGINCLELTGDNEFYTSRNIHEADIILTTPEKFDAVSRYGIQGGGLSFFSDIALLLIDEVHLLNDPRGAALEAIVSRIKIVACNPKMKLNPLAQVRFLAVSATIPNIEDLAKWLEVPDQGIKRFGEEMRPVKLTTKVFGYAPAKNDFLFEKRLQNYIFDILMQFSRGKSALIFCSTRKGAQEAAQRLSQIVMTFGQSNPFIKNREQQDRLREASLSCSDKQMQSYILYGVGYHNGGLCLKDRNLVEGLFLKGDIQVLCTTNTLAHGINLPAHTVVIKSTQHFNKEKGLYMEYDRSTILQMCGRAGRPPFDDTGMVIIMTRRETVHLYENLLNGCEVVESQLLSCVTEHLLAEIVQLTVSDITKAIEWMKCSYLYVRMKRNPMNYAIKKGISGDRLERHVQEICIQKVNELSQHQMVWVDDDGFLLRPLDPGRLMTKYYLRFGTMKQIMRTPENCSLEDALHVVCCAEEIAWIQLRRNEKKLLNEINADKDGRLRFHILGDKGKKKKRIQSREEKIFIIANDCLTGDPSVHDLSLIQDMNSICSNGCRIAKCMKDYFVYKRNYKGAVNSALLAKSLDQKLWDDSQYLLKQLPGIGMVTAKALHSMEIKSFEALAEADPRRIEIVTGRKYPFGNHIKDSLLLLPPKVDVKLEEIESHGQGKSKLVVTLTRMSQSGQSVKRHFADMIIGSEEDNTILFHEKISPYSATILVPIQQGKQTIKADFIFEEYIGIDVRRKLTFMRESNSTVLLKRNRKQVSFPPPEEIYVIEDDNITVPHIPRKEPCSLSKDKEESDSIPSFDLLDEKLEEGGRALEVEEDKCKIITEKTVFDHIREKAKNFSLLSAFDNIRCPSLEVLLARNHAREKRPDRCHEVVVLDDEDRLKVPQLTDVNLPAELRKADHDDINLYLTLNDPNTAGSSNNMSSILDTGVFLPEPEARTNETSTEETVFEHIRRKSKDFPLISKLDCMDSIIHKTELFSKNHPSFSSSLNATFGMATETDSSDMVTDNMLTSFMETAEVEKYSSSVQVGTEVKRKEVEGFCSIDGVLNISKGVSSTNSVQSSICVPTVSFSVLKEKKRSSDPGSFAESSKKQHCSSRESKEEKCSSSEIRSQRCSLETAGQMKERQPYLGFKSVFSFL